jgi:hypothetical protein
LILKLKEIDEKESQPDEIIKILLECGFTDNTPTTPPHEDIAPFEIVKNSNLTLKEIQSLDDFELIESLIEKNLFVIVRKFRNASKTSFSSGFFRAYGNIVDAECEFKTMMRQNPNSSWALLKSKN